MTLADALRVKIGSEAMELYGAVPQHGRPGQIGMEMGIGMGIISQIASAGSSRP